MIRVIFLSGHLTDPATLNVAMANVAAVAIAFWMRLSVESYPGIRRAYLILLSVFVAHGCTLLWFLLTRYPYDRVGLVVGFVMHVSCLYALFASVERVGRRIAVVPFGKALNLEDVPGVQWILLSRPRLYDARGCHAIVADFNANLPNDWEGFLAEAALQGRVVYQVKQLRESLTGRVELEHLSENSFGSLVPAMAYYYVKYVADLALAIVVLPISLPLLLAVAAAIYIDDGGPAIFQQKRIGHAGKVFTVYKFRTMRTDPLRNDREAAITDADDNRVTRAGRLLRKYRLDEIPQIFNILRGEMSWIGPRPEPEVVSRWYQGEIAFYQYRHVVKPGISGWAQVNQGYVGGVEEISRKLQYDFYYIKYFSPWLDLLILIRTLKTMLTGSGAR